MVIDIDNDHNSQETAERVAKMYLQEVFKGRYHKRPNVTDFPNAKKLDEIYTLGPISVRSACSHHICLLYTSPSPRDKRQSRMPSSA